MRKIIIFSLVILGACNAYAGESEFLGYGETTFKPPVLWGRTKYYDTVREMYQYKLLLELVKSQKETKVEKIEVKK